MKIYLAGPDVFRPDAEYWADKAQALCRQYGFDALLPTDHQETTPERIFEANLMMIRKAQIVAANLDPFRGAEPDSGTAFELGYALALGKKVCGYVTTRKTTTERFDSPTVNLKGQPADDNGYAIEDFGLPCNLMLAVPANIIEGGLEDCLKSLCSRSVSLA